MSTNDTTSRTEDIYIVYEIAHVPDAIAYVKRNAATKIISLNAWAERAIRDQGIEVIPLSQYCPPFQNTSDLMRVTRSIAHEWYRIPEMAFFEYRGISLGEAYESGIFWYLERVFYHLHVFGLIAAAHPNLAHMVMSYSGAVVPDTARALGAFEENVAVDTAKLIAERYGFELVAIGTPAVRHAADAATRKLPYHIRRLGLKMINTFVRLVTRQRPVRVFASDYWRNIGPIIHLMDDVELVLMDRREFWSIPWKDIFTRRIRSIHPQDVIRRGTGHIVEEHMRILKSSWLGARGKVGKLTADAYGNLSVWEILAPALDYLMEEYSARVIADAEAIFYILQKEHISRVLLRASVSSQYHFYLIEQAARTLGIPSVELQHGMEISDPFSPRAWLHCDYLAAYGAASGEPLVRNYGYAPERIVGVGSPRFDGYKRNATVEARTALLSELGLDSSRPVVACAVQMEIVDLSPHTFSSYDLVEYFAKMRALKDRIPSLQFIFKFKPHGVIPAYWEHVNDIFPEGGVVLVDDRSIPSVFQASDVVMCGNTTLVYEALILGIPLVLYPIKPADTAFLITHSPDALVPKSDEECADMAGKLIHDPEFRSQALKRQNEALHSRYSFDGHASESVAKLLRSPLKSFPRKDW